MTKLLTVQFQTQVYLPMAVREHTRAVKAGDGGAELVEHRNGVLVRYTANGQLQTVLVPWANIAAIWQVEDASAPAPAPAPTTKR